MMIWTMDDYISKVARSVFAGFTDIAMFNSGVLSRNRTSIEDSAAG
jgi:hypothetical protein